MACNSVESFLRCFYFYFESFSQAAIREVLSDECVPENENFAWIGNRTWFWLLALNLWKPDPCVVKEKEPVENE